MLLPWTLPALGIMHFSPLPTLATTLALCGGAFFLGSYFFYFRALFRFADSPLILVLWETQVVVVPFLAWLCFNERLLPVHYLGIGLAFISCILFAARGSMLRQGFSRVAGTMLWAVLLFAGSMVAQKEAYRIADGRFFDVFLVFSLGGVLLAVSISLFRPTITLARFRRLSQFKSSILCLLVLGEIVSCGVLVFSQRAIHLAPSASFVSAIESSVVAFTMLFSVSLAAIFGRTRYAKITTMFHQQTHGWKEKLVAMALMSTGIYCIAG